MFRSLGLALVGLMHPRMLWLSFRPFLWVALVWGALFFFFWETSLETIRLWITDSFLTAWLSEALSSAGWDGFRAFVAPLLLVVLLIPLIAISLLIVIAFTSVPGVITHIAKQQRYAHLHQAQGGGLLGSIAYALVAVMVCLLLVLLTLPIWWVPPMVAILPPIIWGWLTMKLMAYDVLAKHASVEERNALMQKHRWSLLEWALHQDCSALFPLFSGLHLCLHLSFSRLFLSWCFGFTLWFLFFLHYGLRITF